MTIERRFTERQAKTFIKDAHREAYDKLLLATASFTPSHWPRAPTFTVTDSVFRHCGQYSPMENACQYSLAYCVHLGEEYRETIDHEVAHAFVWFMHACGGHDERFFDMMRLAGYPEPDRYHSHPVLEIERLSEVLKAERLSAGGVINDISFGVRRKSLAERLKERSAL